MVAVIQFVARVSGWYGRDASATVTAITGLPKATDGSARSVPNFAASHASDGGGICVINVCREVREDTDPLPLPPQVEVPELEAMD